MKPLKPFPEEPSFTPGEVGFDDKDANDRPYDLLGRKPLGQRLTDLLDQVEQPLVIALDGGWGSGKSHFLKLWTGAHEKELSGKAKVIYFDAFEHDFLDDPLVSLVARLTSKEADATWSGTAIRALKKAALPLARLTFRIGAAAATAGATELAGPVMDAAIAKTGQATEASIDAFWKRETGRIAAMQQFRDALTALTNDGDSPQKIVFIIDELDRCRPDYALSLLEIVKHFFAVPNVHFVLGTNMAALEASVHARYGLGVAAHEYLTKFVHLRMSFPVVRDYEGNDAWATYFDARLDSIGPGPETRNNLRQCLEVYSQNAPISLRDVDRLAGRFALFPRDIERYMDSAYRYLAASALVMQVFAPTKFARLRTGRLEMDEFVQIFPQVQSDRKLAHYSSYLTHLWRRVLLDDPGEETMKAVERAFDDLRHTDRKHNFGRLWSDLFDTFQLIEGP